MNALAPIQVRPDIGGIVHLLFSPGNPLHADILPAPMILNAGGRPTHVDLDLARKEHPTHYLVSYNPKDQTSTILPLRPSVGWYTPQGFQQRLIYAAIERAISYQKPPNEGITL